MKDFLKKIKKGLGNESVSSGKKEVDIKSGIKRINKMKPDIKSGIKRINKMKPDIKRKIIKEKKVKPGYPFKTRYPKDPKEKEARVFEVKDTKTIEKKPIKYRSK